MDESRTPRNLPAIVETRFQMVESRLTVQTSLLERIDARMDKYDTLIQAMTMQAASVAATLQAVQEQTKMHGEEMKDIKHDQIAANALLAKHDQRFSGSTETRNVIIGIIVAIGSALIGHYVK